MSTSIQKSCSVDIFLCFKHFIFSDIFLDKKRFFFYYKKLIGKTITLYNKILHHPNDAKCDIFPT